MSRSINRARSERQIVKRSRYGRFDTGRTHRTTIEKRYLKQRFAWMLRPARQLPIRVMSPHPYAHHPVSEADIREVLRRLPDAYVGTVGEIWLTRGAERDFEPDPESEGDPEERDAWIGRRGVEQLPGVFWGNTLGNYQYRDAKIRLHAIVYDPSLPGRAMWEVLFRLCMLSTLVHEVGHHRWAHRRAYNRDGPTSEEHARAYEAFATRRYVVPYLERTYPDEIDLLLSWIERHLGVRLSLASLHSDWTDGYVRAFSGLTPGSAVEHLVKGLAEGTEPRELRRDFARDLHYGAKYDEALRIVDLLLRDDPDHFDTLDLRACIARDQGRCHDAQALARDLTVRFPLRYRAWDRLVSASEDLQDWSGVLEATNAIVALPDFAELRPYQQQDTFLSRAHAYFELGASDAALQDLDRLPEHLPPRVAKQVEELRAKITEKQAALAR